MFDSPISKTQGQLAQAARAATNDYIQNGTDLTEAVVKAASAMQPLTSEHVRRICEMTYHDAYERMFAEKTGMHQYVTFDPPDAILAAEMLDALQLGLNNQANFDKLAMDRHQYHDEVAPMEEAHEMSKTHGPLVPLTKDQVAKLKAKGFKLTSPPKHVQEGYWKAMARRQQEMKKEASIKEAAKTQGPAGDRSFVMGEDSPAEKVKKQKTQEREKLKDQFRRASAEHDMAKAKSAKKVNPKDVAKAKNIRLAAGLTGAGLIGGGLYYHRKKESMGKSASIQDDAEQVVRQTLEDASTPKGLARLIASKALKHDREGVIIKKLGLEKEASMEQDLTPSMPRKFKRMNTHEFWTKAASGKDLPDHNPTRELQQVHRDLKDSISTVKSELYSAEHNEKLAMIDMVKQARAGLSAGHSMEQVLHAAVSVVDATEPLMAKTAHDLCATIIEACADHQNSGFRKTASAVGKTYQFDSFRSHSSPDDLSYLRPGSFMWSEKHKKALNNKKEYDAHMKATGGDKSIGFIEPLQGKSRKDAINELSKQASALQEVNPNHPIPQKFKKLAEANIQRKHLEVTLDELNRNLDYFNEQLKDELFR